MREERTLFVILKTVERCNLNCKYCYFFNQGEESYKKHPAFIPEKTIEQLISFLKQGVQDLKISTLRIAFHGGEPTLQPIAQFNALCSLLKAAFPPDVEVDLSIQTNGTLINDRWIDAFARHNVSVGVSLDGPPEYNDIDRVDHQNKGSYAAARKGIEALKKAHLDGKIGDIGALCVINPHRDAKVIYRHFVDELRFSRMDFLLPDFTHDNFDFSTINLYGDFLCNLLDEWIKDNNPNIRLRYLESILRMMAGKKGSLAFFGPDHDDTYAVTISSDGSISPDDTLRTAARGKLMQLTNIGTTSLKEFFEFPVLKTLASCKAELPKKCKECCWQNICCGGQYIHRFSQSNGFDNPSIMCEALKRIYVKAARFLIDNGFPLSKIEELLCSET